MDVWGRPLLACNVRPITTALEATAWPVLMELSVLLEILPAILAVLLAMDAMEGSFRVFNVRLTTNHRGPTAWPAPMGLGR